MNLRLSFKDPASLLLNLSMLGHDRVWEHDQTATTNILCKGGFLGLICQ